MTEMLDSETERAELGLLACSARNLDCWREMSRKETVRDLYLLSGYWSVVLSPMYQLILCVG